MADKHHDYTCEKCGHNSAEERFNIALKVIRDEMAELTNEQQATVLARVLMTAFPWAETKEGGQFWCDTHDRLSAIGNGEHYFEEDEELE